jgi:hypothetical protein
VIARTWVGFAALYSILTVAYAWPLLGVFSTALPNDTGDPGLNAWIMWWNAQAVPLTERWWNAPIFHPVSGAFAFSETLLALSVLSTPLIWAGLSPIETYNTLFLLSYPSAALAAHALAFWLTGRHDAAAIAGAAFGFSPYRAAQIPHLQMLWALGMPLCLLAIHRYTETRRPRDLLLAGASWLLTALSCGYYLVFFPVLVGLWMLWFVRSLRDWLALLLTFALSSAPLVPLLIGYQRHQSALGFERPRSEILTFSADLGGLWSTRVTSWPARLWTLDGKFEGELYPGATVLLLVGAAAWVAWRRAGSSSLSRTQYLLVAGGALTAALSVALFFSGGWQAWFLGIEVSLTRPGAALFVGVLMCFLAWAIDPRVQAMWRRRSALFFYSAAALVMLTFALGPEVHAFGRLIMAPAPYAWLMSLPGGGAVRVPGRFGMLMVLSLSVAAAIAFSQLRRPGGRPWMVATLTAAIVLEGWVWPFHAALLSHPSSVRRSDAQLPVFEIPLRGTESHTEAMVRATAHGHPLFNGYSGYLPLHVRQLESGVNERDPSVLEALQQLGPLLVAVNQTHDRGGRYATYVEHAAGAGPRYRTPFGPVFQLPSRRAPARRDDVVRLAVNRVLVNSNHWDAQRAIDGNPSTWWRTAKPQEDGDELTMVFDEPVRLARLEIDLGGDVLFYPRVLRIQRADEGEPATTVWEGRTAGLALLGTLSNHVRAPVIIDLPETAPARRFVLGTLERHREFPWVVAELHAFGASGTPVEQAQRPGAIGSPPR